MQRQLNQYERGKHVPDFSIAKRLSEQLGISVTYLYADDDQLAKLIQKFNNLEPVLKRKLLAFIHELGGEVTT